MQWTFRLLALLAALMPLAAACDGDGEPAAEPEQPAGEQQEPTPEPPAEQEQPTDDAAYRGIEGPQTLTVGDTGEIDFEFADRRVSLIQVRPGQGWSHTVEEDDEEIEVRFRQDGRAGVDVEVDPDNGGLDIDVEYQRGTPEGPQTLTAGTAGEIDYEITARAVRLVEVRPGQGWSHTVEDDDEEVEIAFRDQEAAEVDVEIELDG